MVGAINRNCCSKARTQSGKTVVGISGLEWLPLRAELNKRLIVFDIERTKRCHRGGTLAKLTEVNEIALKLLL
jgi:hypothetical protein